MAVAKKAMYTGTDSIMQAISTLYDEIPYFSLWQGNMLLYAYAKDDIDKGRQLLKQLFEGYEQEENTDLLTIKFHPDKDKNGHVTSNTPTCGTMIVRIVELPEKAVGAYQGENMPFPQYKAFTEFGESVKALIQSNHDAMNSRLLALEEDTEEAEEPTDLISRIGTIINHPTVSKLLESPAVMGLLERFLPGFPAASQTTAQVSGIKDNMSNSADQAQMQTLTQPQIDSINASLQRLSAHCDIVDTLAKLADYADNNTVMFKTILPTLK